MPAGGRSVAVWLSVAIAGALLLSSAVTFGSLYALGRAERIAAFEAAVHDDLRSIANVTLTFPDDDLYVNLQPEVMTPYLAGGTRFFQVWDAEDGEALDLSASLEALVHRFERPRELGTEPRRWDAVLPDGREVAVVAIRASAHWGLDQAMLERTGLTLRDREVILLVARARSELAESLLPLAWSCIAGAIALPALAGLLLWVLVPRALRPLRRLSADIERRDAEDTSALPEPGVSELQPIVRHLNGLLERIDGQRSQERRFLADAAHELRSPLAELHTLADVAMLVDQGGEAHLEALSDAKALAGKLARQVDSLFHLARYGHSPCAPARIALAPLLRTALRSHPGRAGQHGEGVLWHVDVADEVQVLADANLLCYLLDNLSINADAHGQPGSTGLACVDEPRSADKVVLRLRNRCGTPAARDGDHLQRGLCIAALYARAIGAELETRAGPQTFEVCLSLPAATQALSAAGAPYARAA